MKIAIFRIGNLGDTLLALPVFNVIRRRHLHDEITLVCSKNRGGLLNASDVLTGTGLVDWVIEYDAETKGVARLKEMRELAGRLRRARIDRLFYVAPSLRRLSQVRRDKLFFNACGIRDVVGMKSFKALKTRSKEGALLPLEKETRYLLDRLEEEGISAANAFLGLPALLIGQREKKVIDRFLPVSGTEIYVAFGIGGKAPAKKWPVERFQKVGRLLIEHFRIFPIVFGGREDQVAAEELVQAWGKGRNLCGVLNVRESAEGLRRCRFYLGHDAGTMHLAAFMGVPCVAIFSARSNPGLWEPWGKGHTVLRKSVPCEGCELNVCNVKGHPCMERISVNEVVDAAAKYLVSKPA